MVPTSIASSLFLLGLLLVSTDAVGQVNYTIYEISRRSNDHTPHQLVRLAEFWGTLDAFNEFVQRKPAKQSGGSGKALLGPDRISIFNPNPQLVQFYLAKDFGAGKTPHWIPFSLQNAARGTYGKSERFFATLTPLGGGEVFRLEGGNDYSITNCARPATLCFWLTSLPP
jgi:hypothetical protein